MADQLVELHAVAEMPVADVSAQLELLTQQARERIRNPDSPGSELDYMTSDERTLRQALLDKLPTAAQDRKDAAARIRERVQARRGSTSVKPPGE